MAEVLCTVALGERETDDGYTFYSDGKIEYNYDRMSVRFHKWIKPAEIDDSIVQLLLEKCPYEFKDKVKTILKK